ncbi:GvpL/GvpF family gas vesicle protein [Staphylococcus simulans]|uniref:GvpL/GvpF family gas vesicle protein n=1 Tax=Staphylococcus simulans TaxID=1286 RepID=UPI003F7D5F21
MAQEDTGVYVFCGTQTDRNDDFRTVEVEGEERELFTIRYKDAAIVAAVVPMKIYAPKKENLIMHQTVVSTVMKEKDAVIPISFGNVFKSKDDVKVLLEKLYPQFETLFPEIKGKFELGLKVIGKQEWLESIVKDDPELQKMAESVKGKSEDVGYYDRIKLGSAMQNVFKALTQKIEEDIYQPLANISTAAKSNEPQSEKMLLNAAFLVDSEHDQAFDDKVNQLHEEWKDKVDFKYTGPWAAYNFVNIRLNIE